VKVVRRRDPQSNDWYKILHPLIIQFHSFESNSQSQSTSPNIQAFVGTMIKNQPLYIKGIDASNQELTKENAFGAMGMFIFLFSSSAIYICCYKHRNNEHQIRSQGYMRPSAMQRLGSRDYHVELPHSPSLELQHDSDDEVEVDEMSSILS